MFATCFRVDGNSQVEHESMLLSWETGQKQGKSERVQNVFGDHIRYRPKGVFRKGVRNASEMRQKCVRNASKRVLFYWEKRNVPLFRQKSVKIASKMRQKCAEHLWGRTPFGRYRHVTNFVLHPCNPRVHRCGALWLYQCKTLSEDICSGTPKHVLRTLDGAESQ